jgi:D-alanyl-D-alanine carboxypeptidase
MTLSQNRLKPFRCSSLLLFLGLLAYCLVGFSGDGLANNKKKAKQKPYSPPYAHIVVDAATGKVLSQDGADKALHPASLTKIMTLLMVFEALDSKKITLKSSVPVSTFASKMSPSKIGIKPGNSISVENAIKALVTKSANDVSVAIAEKLGGTEARFARMMTERAKSIGMTKTRFLNASGLHNPAQLSSARDMAKLAIYIMRKYPHYYHYFSLREFTYAGKTHTNHNRLMTSYRGMDGMKTGYIRPSGFNLVSSARRGNTRIIGVVFGGKTAVSRNERMADLLDAGFARGHYNTDSDTIRPYDPTQPKQASTTEPTGSSAGLKKLSHNNSQPPQKTDKSEPILKKSEWPPQQEIPLDATWSIQIGAFQDRVSTDQVIYRALQKLPAPLNRGRPVIVPLRTAEASWVFRARIAGYSREQAVQACRHLQDCLTIAPQSR